MNKDLEAIAQKVIDKIPKKDENFGFIITVLMIISITLTLIRVIQECNKTRILSLNSKQKNQFFNSEVKSLSIKKTWFTRMTLKKIIRKELPKDMYKEYGYDLMNAFLSVGADLTEQETETLMEAANV